MSFRILQFSDSHLGAILDTPRALLDKRFFGVLNSRLARAALYCRERTDRAIALICREKPDLVLFTGDAVSSGSPAEFKSAMTQFRPLAESGLPVLYAPGNHDCYVSDPACVKAKNEFYESLTKRPCTDKAFLYEAGGLRFLTIDTARPTNPLLSCGFLDDETLAFVRREAEKDDVRPLVLVGHFPIRKEQPFLTEYRRSLRGKKALQPLLDSGRIALSLCGHIHHADETLDERGYGEVIAGSVSREGIVREIVYENGKFLHRRLSV